MIVEGREVDARLQADVAVVGAGPAGIVVALELAAAGLEVALIESGRDTYDPRIQALADAAEWNRDLHAPLALATRRQVGGASVIWGGRCVPYDPIDFDRRPWIGSAAWPVAYEDVTPYFQRACDWLACGRAVFDAARTSQLAASLVPGLPNENVTTSTLERWSLPTNFGRTYRRRLSDSPRIRLVTGTTCTRIVTTADGSGVDHLACATQGGKPLEVAARRYVLACGGLETTRLLLASPAPDGRAIGNHSDHLGRWYMGHVEGVVASVRLRTPPRGTLFDFERDDDGVYVRRRFAFSRAFQQEQELPNVAAWLVHPELADAAHGSGMLSAAYLALASPFGARLAPEALRRAMTGERIPGVPYGGAVRSSVSRHLDNIARDLPATLRFAVAFGEKRFLARGRRVPGFAVYRRDNTYPLQYHGEHRPRHDSRVMLTDQRDALGMPRLRIDVRFSDSDVDGIVRAHHHLDDYLRRHAVGAVEPAVEDVAHAVRSRLGAGFHQTGSARMSASAGDGVVDADLAVHGVPTLYVASSATFPTSSQANSTFMIVVFALRLADRLRRER